MATLLTTTWPLFSADLRLDYKPAAHAIVGATIVTGRGETIEGGTVVVRQGVIEAVGPAAAVTVPFDAEKVDGKGLYVYPGFLDLFNTAGQATGAVRSRTGAGRELPYADYAYPRTPVDNRLGLTPEYQVASALELTESLASERRQQGFTAMLVAPSGAIATGQSALASLSGLPRREVVIKTPVALHVSPRNPGGLGSGFRESSSCDDDEAEIERARSSMAAQDPAPAPTQTPSRPATPPETTPAPSPSPSPGPATPAQPDTGRRRGGAGGGSLSYPSTLMGVIAHLRQAMLDAEHHQALRAYHEDKGGPRPPVDPTLDALNAARGRAIPVWWEANTRDEIHRVLDLAEEFGASAVIVGGREAWKVADRLKARGVPVVLRVDLPEEPRVPSRREFVEKRTREWSEPLAVLEDRKARWAERAANAAALARAGVRFAFATEGLSRPDTFHAQVRKLIDAGLPVDAAVAALTRDAAAIVGLEKQLGTLEPGMLGQLVALTGPYGKESSRPRYVFADGLKFDLEKEAATATAKPKGGGGQGRGPGGGGGFRKGAGGVGKAAEATSKKAPSEPEKSESLATEKPAGEKEEPFVDVASELEAQRKPATHTGGNAFIKGARILTATRGAIDEGNILIVGGKIEAIGPDAKPRPDSKMIEARGLVAAPGFIDTHSHIAIQGGINEASLSIVPEVRVRDVVTGDDPAIFRALAGGTTTARLLHGSANTIGGQDAVIKLKPGEAGRDLLVKGGGRGSSSRSART